MSSISSQEAFKRLCKPQDLVCIDVRSEGEFHDGHFEGVKNIPILNNDHRHQVGLTYKTKGQDAAIEKGHNLVDPLKPELLDRWKRASQNKETLVYCWRGGLRSRISCEWMSEHQINTVRIEGGYKALRAEVLPHFVKPWTMKILGGMTGSQKTEVLKTLPHHIDLEGLANHRGSAFGLLIQDEQPRQATFENNLAVKLSDTSLKHGIILEDESRLIGHCVIPEKFYSQMSEAPMVLIEESVKARAEYIYRSYVQLSLAKAERVLVLDHFQKSLLKITKRLGGLLTDQLLKVMNEAFFQNSAELHQQWIESLLVNYYDKMYLHAFNRKGRKVIFRGTKEEVKGYLNI